MIEYFFFVVFDGRDEYKRKRKYMKVLKHALRVTYAGLSAKYLPTAAALGHAGPCPVNLGPEPSAEVKIHQTLAQE